MVKTTFVVKTQKCECVPIYILIHKAIIYMQVYYLLANSFLKQHTIILHLNMCSPFFIYFSLQSHVFNNLWLKINNN